MQKQNLAKQNLFSSYKLQFLKLQSYKCPILFATSIQIQELNCS